MLYLSSDHRGFKLKKAIEEYLKSRKINFEDLGNEKYDSDDDYPDFAKKTAEKVLKNPKTNKGILICGSGQGMCISANKYPGIRAALALSPQMAKNSSQSLDINILCLSADKTDKKSAFRIIDEWLKAKFKKIKRYQRRLDKIKAIENKFLK